MLSRGRGVRRSVHQARRHAAAHARAASTGGVRRGGRGVERGRGVRHRYTKARRHAAAHTPRAGPICPPRWRAPRRARCWACGIPFLDAWTEPRDPKGQREGIAQRGPPKGGGAGVPLAARATGPTDSRPYVSPLLVYWPLVPPLLSPSLPIPPADHSPHLATWLSRPTREPFERRSLLACHHHRFRLLSDSRARPPTPVLGPSSVLLPFLLPCLVPSFLLLASWPTAPLQVASSPPE